MGGLRLLPLVPQVLYKTHQIYRKIQLQIGEDEVPRPEARTRGRCLSAPGGHPQVLEGQGRHLHRGHALVNSSSVHLKSVPSYSLKSYL